MQVFLRVVDTGSFSEAARMLKMTPSTISKLIGRIETRLGVRLLERSTRRLSLTNEGQAYYDRSQALLTELEEIERDLSKGAAQMGGTVRVNASVGFGMVGLEPLLPAFWDTYPNVAIDLALSDEIVDLYLDRTDVAFRVGALHSSSLKAVKLGTAARKIVAAPAYLARRGTLRLTANNGETMRRMAVAGMGIARMGEFHIREDLAAGRLIEILPEAVIGDTEDIHAVFPGGRHVPHRVRAFLDFMTPRLRDFLAR